MAIDFEMLDLNEWYEAVNNPMNPIFPDIENEVWFVRFKSVKNGRVKADFITDDAVCDFTRKMDESGRHRFKKSDEFPFITKFSNIESVECEYINGYNIRNKKLKMFIIPNLLFKMVGTPTSRYDDIQVYF